MTADFSIRVRQLRDALFAALDEPVDAIRPADQPLRRLSLLVESVSANAGGDDTALGALTALAAVARRSTLDDALSTAATLFSSAHRLREAVYFTRCLDRDPEVTLRLLRARSYLEAAVVPAATDAASAADQAALLDHTTFAGLWHEPRGHRSMLEAIEAWRRRYVPLYLSAHAAHQAAVGSAAQMLATLSQAAGTVEKLNGLKRLGPPLALIELLSLQELEQLSPCPIGEDDLRAALRLDPVCPHCGFRIGNPPPDARARQVKQGLAAAFVAQQARLNRHVLAPLRARRAAQGDQRLERFLRAVQAGDLTVLNRSLDEGMLAFLEDVLESNGPDSVLDQLGYDFPEVNAGNLDSAVAAFRRILESELQRSGGRVVIRREDGGA